MNIKLIDKVLGPLNEFIAREAEMLPFAEDKGFLPVKITEENFHTLAMFSDDAMLYAVDGGNAELISAPNLSLSFVRVVGVGYKENKKAETIVKEFFCFVTAENKGNKLMFKAEIIGDNLFGKELSFESFSENLDGEKINLEISAVAGIVRRLAELKMIKSIIESSKEKIYLVADGSVKAKYKEELDILKEISVIVNSKNYSVAFLSKTCRLLTKNGASLNSVLNEKGPKASWYYHPVFEVKNSDYLGELCFVKLNGKSKYVFKLEIMGKKIDEIVLKLSLNSTDPVFYGYPYCLVEADKTARVSNQEKEYLKTIFISKVKDKNKFAYLVNNLDSHDVLDRIG